MQDYHKLAVWQKAHALVLSVYPTTGAFPRHEAYGLTALMRRTATNIPSRIADGCGRSTDIEFLKELHTAVANGNDLEYQFLLAKDLNYIDAATHERLNAAVVEVKRMLMGLIRTIKT